MRHDDATGANPCFETREVCKIECVMTRSALAFCQSVPASSDKNSVSPSGHLDGVHTPEQDGQTARKGLCPTEWTRMKLRPVFAFPRHRASRGLRRLSLSALISLALPMLSATAVSAGSPPFGSTADTVFDIITTEDPSSFVCLAYDGRTTRQMWDKRVDNEFDLEVFLFRAYFSDGPAIDIIVNPEFETRAAAETEARRYTHALGQLPMVLRHGIRQLGIHGGMPTYSAGAGKIFVYADRTTIRIDENHLEESLLHEAAHVSLDPHHRSSQAWTDAQKSDGGFVTDYAERNPEREDLAETALFAYAFLHHPDRLPPVDSADVRAAVPARLQVLTQILKSDPEIGPLSDPPTGCR